MLQYYSYKVIEKLKGENKLLLTEFRRCQVRLDNFTNYCKMIESTCKIEEGRVQAVRIVYENRTVCTHLLYSGMAKHAV